MFDIFFVSPPGIEQVTRKEIQNLISTHKLQVHNFNTDKLELTCDLKALYTFNLCLRTPNRILVRALKFKATNFAELVDKSSKFSWENYIQKETLLKIRTTCKKSRLYHSDAVTERVIAGIKKRVGFTPNAEITKIEEAEMNEQLVIVRFFRDECTISIDSSGVPLHQRGYRTSNHKAPIRENLAAAMLLSSNWTADKPLLDPFCGSGTIPIEAAMIAKNIAPGINRDFRFTAWKGHNENLFRQISKQLEKSVYPDKLKIFGSDRNEGAIQMAVSNAKNINLSEKITFDQTAFSVIEIPQTPGFIITNPPYGTRINDKKDIRNLYAQFGNLLREKFSGWEVIFLCNDHKLATQTKLPIKKHLSFSNGGIPVTAYYVKLS